jgi:hypothetical protein
LKYLIDIYRSGVNMSKQFAFILLFNVLVGLCFVFANIYFWQYLNGYLTWNNWNPLQIAIAHMIVTHGVASPAGTFIPIPNYPFILFWISTIGNLCLTAMILGKKESKQTKIYRENEQT